LLHFNFAFSHFPSFLLVFTRPVRGKLNFHGYLISQFYSISSIHENFMYVNITWFTVVCTVVRILCCAFASRLSGRVRVVRKLRDAFDTGGRRPSLESIDVHSVASLLKSYLCDLPQPIIPVEHYDRVMHIVTRERPVDSAAAISALSDAIQQLPRTNYNLLQYLCGFLHDVAQCSEVNQMTASNLAMVFSPCIIKPEVDDPALLAGTAMNRTTAVQDMIENFTRIFPSNGAVESLAHNCSVPSHICVNKEEAQRLVNGSETQWPPDIVKDAEHSVDKVEENTAEKDLIELGSSSAVNDKKVNTSDSSLHEQLRDTAESVADVDNELQVKIVMLQQQLQAERCSVENLRQQTELLAKKLDEERSATSRAVTRVVELQQKLQQYNEKFGPLD